MYRVFKLLIIGFMLFAVNNMFAQQTDSVTIVTDSTNVIPKRILTGFELDVDTMSKVMTKAEAAESATEKSQLSDRFEEILIQTLKKENSFSHMFDSIPYVKQLISADSLVRIFSWSIPTEKKGVHNYHCIIQYRKVKTTKVSDVFVLDDTKNKIPLPEHEVLKYPNWYGCDYYQMVQKTDGKKIYYTLIGHDFNDGNSFKKCIDVLTFDRRNNPVFGAPIFLIDKKPQDRIIFEYSVQSVMKVSYYPEIDQIAFNYLYPVIPEKKNDRRYYVSDGTYEGLMFKLGKWIKIPLTELPRDEKHK